MCVRLSAIGNFLGGCIPAFREGVAALVNTRTLSISMYKEVQASNCMSRDWRKKPMKSGVVESDASGHAHAFRGKPAHFQVLWEKQNGRAKKKGKIRSFM